MELKVKELLKKRGMRMADLAGILGVDQSNLVRSLEGNPTLSRLEEIAKTLGVPIQELLPDAPPSSSAGVLTMGDKRFALVPLPNEETEEKGTPPEAQEMTQETLKGEICNLVQQCSEDGKQRAICGSLSGRQIVILYDEDRKNYMWLLRLDGGKIKFRSYTRFFVFGEDNDKGTMEWDGDVLADLMLEEINSNVL